MMQAVALQSASGGGMPSRGACSVSDAQTPFDRLVGETRAAEASGDVPNALSGAPSEEPGPAAVARDGEDDDLAEQDLADLSELPVTTADASVPNDTRQQPEFALQLHDQDRMTACDPSGGLVVGGDEKKLAALVAGSAPEAGTMKVGPDLTSTSQLAPKVAKNAISPSASAGALDKVDVKGDFGKTGNALTQHTHVLPVQMENAIEVGHLTSEASGLQAESDQASELFPSSLSASSTVAAIDPANSDTPTNISAVASLSTKGSEAIASMAAQMLKAEPAKAMPDSDMTTTGIAPDVPKKPMPAGPLATGHTIPEPQPSDILALSGGAEDQRSALTIDQSPPSVLAEPAAQPEEAVLERPVDPARPRSAIVPNVLERVAALPREVGETVIHLKPHGMGLIAVSIQQARDGGLDIVLRIQNPMVLEVMQAERQAVAQAIGGQGSAASGSLTMDLFQSGSGQRGAQGDGFDATSRPGSLPTAEEEPDNVPVQAVTHQIIQSDRVNITT